MSRFTLPAAALLSLFFVASCCSKGGNCDTASVNGIELCNFTSEVATDSINLIRFDRSSNFTTPLDTTLFHGQATSNPNVFMINTGSLELNNDYIVSVVKDHREYRLGNFAYTKKACGKCFMRANNEYRNQLSTYNVNGGVNNFDGAVKIFR